MSWSPEWVAHFVRKVLRHSFQVWHNTSDYSLLILALLARKMARKPLTKTQEKRLSGAVARDGGRAG